MKTTIVIALLLLILCSAGIITFYFSKPSEANLNIGVSKPYISDILFDKFLFVDNEIYI